MHNFGEGDVCEEEFSHIYMNFTHNDCAIFSLHLQRSLDPAQMKLGINETCERIKEEFNFIQSQYHSLKMECEKLAQEKTEMQRHYVMVSEGEFRQMYPSYIQILWDQIMYLFLLKQLYTLVMYSCYMLVDRRCQLK